jgi:hypothetical protein
VINLEVGVEMDGPVRWRRRDHRGIYAKRRRRDDDASRAVPAAC